MDLVIGTYISSISGEITIVNLQQREPVQPIPPHWPHWVPPLQVLPAERVVVDPDVDRAVVDVILAVDWQVIWLVTNFWRKTDDRKTHECGCRRTSWRWCGCGCGRRRSWSRGIGCLEIEKILVSQSSWLKKRTSERAYSRGSFVRRGSCRARSWSCLRLCGGEWQTLNNVHRNQVRHSRMSGSVKWKNSHSSPHSRWQ